MDERVKGRDRSLVAVVEMGAAGLLIVCFFLPWWQVYVSSGTGTVAVPVPLPMASETWGSVLQGWPWTPYLEADLISFGAVAAVVAALVGLVWPGRWIVLATLASFVAAAVGAVSLLYECLYGPSIGGPGPIGYGQYPSPDVGLWLFAGTATLGVGLALIDLRLPGRSTFLSDTLRARQRYRQFLAIGGISVALGLALALAPLVSGRYQVCPEFCAPVINSPDWLAGFWVALVAYILLVGFVLSAKAIRATGPSR